MEHVRWPTPMVHTSTANTDAKAGSCCMEASCLCAWARRRGKTRWLSRLSVQWNHQRFNKAKGKILELPCHMRDLPVFSSIKWFSVYLLYLLTFNSSHQTVWTDCQIPCEETPIAHSYACFVSLYPSSWPLCSMYLTQSQLSSHSWECGYHCYASFWVWSWLL